MTSGYNTLMHISVVPNRSANPAILLRETFRDENGQVKHRTLANLTKVGLDKVDPLRAAFKGGLVVDPDGYCRVTSSLPHGHVAAILGTIRNIGLDKLLYSRDIPQRAQALAMLVSRLISPGSKLAAYRGLSSDAPTSTLAKALGIKDLEHKDLYKALDWLVGRQPAIEKKLAQTHLHDGSMVLYDLTSLWMEGQKCPLSKRGYSRDGRKGTLQITVGLLCTKDGLPIAVEVFPGNTSDAKTLPSQIEKVREKFGIRRVVVVGDRGMITDARIQQDLKPVDGLSWITSLRSTQIKGLIESGEVDRSLFDQTDLAEIEHPDYPGERLIACLNPLLAGRRAAKRESLLKATEKKLAEIQRATEREKRRLQGKDKIALRVGRWLDKYMMAKHFELEISDTKFTFKRKEEAIACEAALDGLYVIRSSVPATDLTASQAVSAYKSLSKVERAFRSLKTVSLQMRPIFHWTESRVRAHVFLCMLAYYVEWHMRKALAPLLFHDNRPDLAAEQRPTPVGPARISEEAKRKARTQETAEGFVVSSFGSLLEHLKTQTWNTLSLGASQHSFELAADPTPLQQRAYALLAVNPLKL